MKKEITKIRIVSALVIEVTIANDIANVPRRTRISLRWSSYLNHSVVKSQHLFTLPTDALLQSI